MVLALNSINPIHTTASTGTSSASSVGNGFKDALNQAIGSINSTQADANNQVEQLINGSAGDLSNVTIALEKSDLTLKLAVNVRDKVVNAYQEVMRMQV
jgi:flagellar hook-basal body complex protein FliE